MWEEIIDVALSNGIWAVLFLGLLLFQLRDSMKREEKCQKTIQDLTEKLSGIESVRDDIVEIKTSIVKLEEQQKSFSKLQTAKKSK